MKKIVSILIITVFSSLDLYAQPAPPSEGDPGVDESGVPIDGGISLLAMAGAGYGIMKLRQHKKAKESAMQGAILLRANTSEYCARQIK